MKVWAYTNTPRYGLREYHGTIKGAGSKSGTIFFIDNSKKYLTGLSRKEGEVRHHTVWFREKNEDRAISLFAQKEIEMAQFYIERAKQCYTR